VPSPTIDDTDPRFCSGIRSASVAFAGALTELRTTQVRVHSRPRTAMLGASHMPARNVTPTRAPKRIHGARRPSRDRVRSEMTPMMGWMIIVAATPVAVIQASD
jgi:hypothetical protein